MPRDGSNIYHRPAGTDGVPNFPIESSKYNAYVADVEQDLNLPRPIVAGGTGANNATDALFNVKGEIATQIVTNWDSQVWVPGSFYAASTATGTAPVAGHNFAGQVYIGEALANPPTNLNVILEARDLDNATPPGALYVRQKKAGVWSAWSIGTVGTLTDAEKTTARQQIYAAPFDALAYNGMQINGGMEISQERGTSFLTLTTGALPYAVDGWIASYKNSSAVITVTPGAMSAFGGVQLPGYNNLIFMQAATAMSALANTDYALFRQNIEGYRVARMGFGTAGASSLSYGFYIYPAVTGTIIVRVQNKAGNRAYVMEKSVVGSSWNWITGTIPVGDVTGTWISINDTGIVFDIIIAGKEAAAVTTNTWIAGGYYTTNLTNQFVSNGTVVGITGVVVIPGIEVPSAPRAPLIMRPYDQELVTCQRYYRQWGGTNPFEGIANGQCFSTTGANYLLNFDPSMRSTPAFSLAGSFIGTHSANTTVIALTALTLATATPNTVSLNGTVAGGLVAGDATKLLCNNDLTVRVKLDARL